MPNRRTHSLRQTLFWSSLAIAAATSAHAAAVDLAGYREAAGVKVTHEGDLLTASWPIDADRTGSLRLNLKTGAPLIDELAIARGGDSKSILKSVEPAMVLTVGQRDLSKQGWIVFFDNPRRHPYEAFPLKIEKENVRVVTENGRTSIVLADASAGAFQGEYRFTFYPGGELVKASAVMTTAQGARAILYDTGLVNKDANGGLKQIAWKNLDDKIETAPVDAAARNVKVRHRTIMAAGDQGTLAIVPAPHQYFYPLDYSNNYATVWLGNGYREQIDAAGVGVRQTIEGDNRWVPWVNAPPGTKQDLSVFYYLSDAPPEQTMMQLLRYTRNDSFAELPGYKTFTSHYHVEHAIDLLNRQKKSGSKAIPEDLIEPEFVKVFKTMGVNAVHLGEFHLGDRELEIADRITRLKVLHDECERLSTDQFLMMPGEEPNVHLGGHWISYFPKPVYWTLDRKKDQPFVEYDADIGNIYHVGSAEDVLNLMKAEGGLMWTAHPRIKGSTGFPDVYRTSDYFKSDRFLGGAWKAMPADLSDPRLGVRVLDLLDDMNNWGDRKHTPGEVDVFQIDDESELYAHMNVNYIRLDRLPAFRDGWQSIVDALRGGRFFTTTGEVLIDSFTIDGKESGREIAAPGEASKVSMSLQWTFPMLYAEVISGDGQKVYRERIDLGDTRARSGRRRSRSPSTCAAERGRASRRGTSPVMARSVSRCGSSSNANAD